jgi:hypothetical protein
MTKVPSTIETAFNCTQQLGHVLNTDPHVQFLLFSIRRLGGRTGHGLRRGISCRSCKASDNHRDSHGYYDSGYQRVVVCADRVEDGGELLATVRHELVHVYDHARWRRFGGGERDCLWYVHTIILINQLSFTYK